MKILAVHNYYQQRGGEDQCFEDEVEVLRAHGHDVMCHTVHNDVIDDRSKVSVAVGTLWNRSAYREISHAIDAFKPDVMHAMNTFPLLSPAILYAAKKKKVPVIQEVQNYRMSCAGTYLLRNGSVCEVCHRWPVAIPAVVNRCYRGSLAGSSVLASSMLLHRMLRTWTRVVDLFLCPSHITRTKLIESGLPADRIVVKPNVLNIDPGIGDGPQGFVVFVGRLSPEKGLSTVLEAWKSEPRLPRIKVIGDGPQAELIRDAAGRDSRIEWLGRMPMNELLNVVGRANCLVMPSLWYETFGRTTIEAFAKGTPVVGSRIGGTAEIISDNTTGWLFEPGNAVQLAQKVLAVMQLEPTHAQQMRSATRAEFLSNYTSKNNYDRLIEAYQRVVDA